MILAIIIIMSARDMRTGAAEGQKQEPEQPKPENEGGASCGVFALFSYLYLMQGAVSGMIMTMPYTYPKLPDIETMALFHSISLPYSFKFVMAPLLEKFTNVDYGKRKTWIVASQFTAAFFMFITSFQTASSEAKTFAILCFIVQICMVIQNIALHSLIIKEIPCASESSLIQCFAEVAGTLLGGLLLLKLSSLEFAQQIGLKAAIAPPHLILIVFAFILSVPVVAVHFNFKEKVLECEKRGQKFTFCQIIKHYSVFLNTKSQYFRFCMFAFFYSQGLNFFTCLYDYYLVEAGFSRNTSNTIGNLVIIPILILTFYFGRWSTSLGGNRNSIMCCTLVVCCIYLYLLIVFPTDVASISVFAFLIGLFESWKFYSIGVMINTFPVHALSGMFITVLGSFLNFGKLTFVHTYLDGQLGWKLLSFVGIGLELVIVGFTPVVFRWLQGGDLTLPKELTENAEQEKAYKQLQQV